MSRLFLCTVGISLLDTSQPGEGDRANAQTSDPIDRAALDSHKLMNKVRKTIRTAKGNSMWGIAAEIQSLHAYLGTAGFAPDDRVVLLYSASLSGQICAAGVGEALADTRFFAPPAQSGNIALHSVAGLQPHDLKAFRDHGLRNLLEIVHDICKSAGHAGAQIVMNITGGYKGILPFMGILGFLYNAELIYVYEDSETVLQLPPLPEQSVLTLDTIDTLLDTLQKRAGVQKSL